MTYLTTLFLHLVSFLIVQAAYAGGCKYEDVEPTKRLHSDAMAKAARNKVLEIEKAMKAKGQDMSVVLIARVSDSLKKFKMIKDDPSVPYIKYLSDLADKVEDTKIALNMKNNSTNSNKMSDTDILELLGLIESNLLLGANSGYDQLGYSHLGFLVKKVSRSWVPDLKFKDDQYEDWSIAVHLLADCDEESEKYGNSKIFYEAFHQFFWDSKLHKKDNNRALIIVPSVSLQIRIMEVIKDQTLRNAFHQPNYNVASTPFTIESRKARLKRLKKITKGKNADPAPEFYQLDNQNSNQLPLEWIAAAAKPKGAISNRKEAQDHLLATNYRASLVIPGGMQGKLGCFIEATSGLLWDVRNIINCKDQVFRDQGITQLMTVGATVEYLKRNNWLAPIGSRSDEYPGIYGAFLDFKTIFALEAEGKKIEYILKESDKMLDQRFADIDNNKAVQDISVVCADIESKIEAKYGKIEYTDGKTPAARCERRSIESERLRLATQFCVEGYNSAVGFNTTEDFLNLAPGCRKIIKEKLKH